MDMHRIHYQLFGPKKLQFNITDVFLKKKLHFFVPILSRICIAIIISSLVQRSLIYSKNHRYFFLKNSLYYLCQILLQICIILKRHAALKSQRQMFMKYCTIVLVLCLRHGLSQQGVWVSFWTPKPLKSTPQDTQKRFCEEFLKMSISSI